MNTSRDDEDEVNGVYLFNVLFVERGSLEVRLKPQFAGLGTAEKG